MPTAPYAATAVDPNSTNLQEADNTEPRNADTVNAQDEQLSNFTKWLRDRTKPVVLSDATQTISKEVGSFRVAAPGGDRVLTFTAGAPSGGDGTTVRFTQAVPAIGFSVTIQRSSGTDLGIFAATFTHWMDVVWSDAEGDWVVTAWSPDVASVLMV